MILKAIFELFKALLLFVIGLFPAIPATDFIGDSFAPLSRILGSIDSFVSVSLIGQCVLAILLFYNFRFLWSIIMWVVHKIPGVG